MIFVGLMAFLLAGCSASPPRARRNRIPSTRSLSVTEPTATPTRTSRRVLTLRARSSEGHDGHNGPVFYAAIPKQDKWGDIIPAFDFGPGEQYAGKNLPAEGQAILDNECILPCTTTTTTTTHPAGRDHHDRRRRTSTTTSTTESTTDHVHVDPAWGLGRGRPRPCPENPSPSEASARPGSDARRVGATGRPGAEPCRSPGHRSSCSSGSARHSSPVASGSSSAGAVGPLGNPGGTAGTRSRPLRTRRVARARRARRGSSPPGCASHRPLASRGASVTQSSSSSRRAASSPLSVGPPSASARLHAAPADSSTREREVDVTRRPRR